MLLQENRIVMLISRLTITFFLIYMTMVVAVPYLRAQIQQQKTAENGYDIVNKRFVFRDNNGIITLDLSCWREKRILDRNGDRVIEIIQTTALISDDRKFAAYFLSALEQQYIPDSLLGSAEPWSRLIKGEFRYFGADGKLRFTKEGITSHPGLAAISQNGEMIVVATIVDELFFREKEDKLPPSQLFVFNDAGQVLYETKAEGFPLGPEIWHNKYVSFHAYDYVDNDISRYMKFITISSGKEIRHDYKSIVPILTQVTPEGEHFLREGDWINQYNALGVLIQKKRAEK